MAKAETMFTPRCTYGSVQMGKQNHINLRI